ncbi:PAS domain-containing protein, partial [Arthrospira platensis SPKY1]|nr:PAS domain-containing protein [Arthrospira platensis SPKY1]
MWGRTVQSLYDNPNSYYESIFEADRASMLDALHGFGLTGNFDIEYRILRPDGSVRWIHARGSKVYDEKGATIYHTGIAMDITNRKQEQELSYQYQFQSILSRLASDLINLPLDRIDQQIVDSLEEIGLFVKAERASVFLFDTLNQSFGSAYEWCDLG